MTGSELRAFFDEKLQWVEQSYAEDLLAMSDEQLSYLPNAGGRTAYDFTYECVVINRRIAKRLAGEDPGPLAENGWMMAPPEFKSKDACMAGIATALREVREAWKSCPEERFRQEIALPNGSTTTALDLVYMVCFHTGYHDAQLNYIQALHGDLEVHWT